MAEYTAPLQDMRFVMNELAGLTDITAMPDCADASTEVVDAVLDEAGKFAAEVLAPLNRGGDQQGAQYSGGNVISPAGFKQAYEQFVAGGWNGLGAQPEFGGQG